MLVIAMSAPSSATMDIAPKAAAGQLQGCAAEPDRARRRCQLHAQGLCCRSGALARGRARILRHGGARGGCVPSHDEDGLRQLPRIERFWAS